MKNILTLSKRIPYLQIAFNGTLREAESTIAKLPLSEKILLEAGTSLIKNYGQMAIRTIKELWNLRLGRDGYIVADLKCMDRGFREVEMASHAGASAATCLGLAPTSTIDLFIDKCHELGIDSMVDMLNVTFPFEVLQKLKKPPAVVILHRGVEEGEQDSKKEIPYWQIHRISGTYNILISVAGGETFREAREAIFNDANIAVVWRPFNEKSSQAASIAAEFLKEIK